MMGLFIKNVLGTVLGRWVTGALVTLLLGSAYAWWHSHKANLREEGRQECIQVVNAETMQILEDQLADERAAYDLLLEHATKTAKANAESRERRHALESKVTSLERAMAEQAETDEDYKEWADTPLPDGVGERMRNQATGSDSGTLREDSN